MSKIVTFLYVPLENKTFINEQFTMKLKGCKTGASDLYLWPLRDFYRAKPPVTLSNCYINKSKGK